MRLGITGTRVGTVGSQWDTLESMLKAYRPVMGYFHHGCCKGVDEEATAIAKQVDYHIVGHPPINKSYISASALSLCNQVLEEKEYLERDDDIVIWSDLLLVVPDSFEKRLHSGTWYTYRAAEKLHKPRIIIWPDGTTTAENTTLINQDTLVLGQTIKLNAYGKF